jgi:hypothetical protein
MNFHELKDVVMIYSNTLDGKPDYDWDKAQIVVWDPEQQQEYDIVFTGSEKGDKSDNYKIHFNIYKKEQ